MSSGVHSKNTLSYGDRSPTLVQILAERNPLVEEVTAEHNRIVTEVRAAEERNRPFYGDTRSVRGAVRR